MKWLEIGTYEENKDGELKVLLHSDYEKALVKLDLFSHVMLFFLKQNQLDFVVGNLINMNSKEGSLEVNLVNHSNALIEGQLIDIKPYFPNEEVVLEAIQPPRRILMPFGGSTIGTYKVQGRTSYFQFEEANGGMKSELEEVLKSVKVGDYLRALWWFHRFDKDNFRRNRMCNPPYNNAPRTGIFASRSPVRPNPLASTVVKVLGVDIKNYRIEVAGFDGFPGSYLLQLMHYSPRQERIEDVTLPPWVDHWTRYKQFEAPKEVKLIKLDNPNGVEIKSTFEEADLITNGQEDLYVHDEIHIKNASIHNLKNVSLTIPKNEIMLISGVSGSGKSSLAFDTLYEESQKQFMDLVLSGQMDSTALLDSKVEKITGLQPAIAIKQKSLGSNPRSTVGSSTRIADLIKLLYSTVGIRLCPNCHCEIDDSNVCASCGHILFDPTPQMFSYNHPDYMCPTCRGLGLEMRVDATLIVEHPERSLLDKASSFYGDLRKHRKKPNANWMRGEVLALAEDLQVDLDVPYKDLPSTFKNEFLYGSNGREVSLAYENSKGRSGIITRPVEGAVNIVERLLRDSKSKSANDSVQRFMSKNTCSRCDGERLLETGRLVHIQGKRYPEVMQMSIDNLRPWCHRIYGNMNQTEKGKCKSLLRKINMRLERIEHVGLPYITLDRSIPSLSGGEAQRLKLATQFGTGLSDILYILDEPSKGLHPKDYQFLMEALEDLKNHGNTVVLVEHKACFNQIADTHVVMGPKAGRYGGEIIDVTRNDNTPVIEYTDDLLLEKPMEMDDQSWIQMKGVGTHNLKNVHVNIPIGKMTAVIGVSGSGKSSLISQTLYPYLKRLLGRSVDNIGQCEAILGIEPIKDVSYVSQKAIGSNSRSNPGTYTGVFDNIRKCFSKLEVAQELKYGKEHFSFNSKKGQCPACKGMGEIVVNMHYMEDIYIPCNACGGMRFNPEVLSIKREGYHIGDILDMEIADLVDVFKHEYEIYEQLQMLEKVGLGYLKLGQSASTLSGGEAQRIKLAKELYKSTCEGVLYILDEPTTGLHSSDIKRIAEVLKDLREKGATIIVIEHNKKLIEACDYAIELGPGGGHRGGTIVRQGYVSRANL